MMGLLLQGNKSNEIILVIGRHSLEENSERFSVLFRLL
jgi:hypothetical protein